MGNTTSFLFIDLLGLSKEEEKEEEEASVEATESSIVTNINYTDSCFFFQLNIFYFMEIQHNFKSFPGPLLYILYSFFFSIFFVLENMVTCTTIS